MAARADRVGAVLLHRLAHRERAAVAGGLLQGRHVGRRQRRRRAEQVLQHPLAAQHRRRAGRVGGSGQDAALAEQPAARGVRQLHAAEVAAVDVRDVVVPCQPLVDEGVVGGQQVEDAPVLAHHALEEELGLAVHRAPQPLAEIGEAVLVRHQRGNVAQVEPLPREVLDQARRALVGEQAPDLRLQDVGLAQLAGHRHVPQLVVRDTAPQEEREPGRQLQIRQSIVGAGVHVRRVAHHAEQELRTHQEPPQGQLDARLEAAFVAPLVVEAQEHVDVAVGNRAAVGAPGQRRHDLAGAVAPSGNVARLGPAGEDVRPARGLLDRRRPARLVRAGDDDAAQVRLIARVAAGRVRVGTQVRLP